MNVRAARTSALFQGSALNAAGQAIPLLVGLACVPFIVRALGAERFGIVALAWTVAGYFTLFDLGLGRAVTKLGAEAQAAAQPEMLRQLIRSAQLIQLVFGLTATAVLMVCADELARALRVPGPLLAEATASFRVLALAIPAILTTTTYRGALEAMQRFDLVNLLRAPLGASTYLLTLAGALLGASTTTIVWLIVAARAAGAIAFAVVCGKTVPRTAPRGIQQAGRLLRFGGWVSVTSALVPLTGYIDRFLVGALVSLAAVAHYAGPYELASRLLILPGAVAAALLPIVSAGAARGDLAGAQRGHTRALRWSALAAGLPALLLFIAAEPVLRVWLGAEYVEAALGAFRILLLAAIANGAALAPFTMLEGLGRPDLLTKYHLIELPVYVALTVLAVRAQGIDGAALVWLLRNIVLLAVLLLLVRHVLRQVRATVSSAETTPRVPAGPGSTRR